jgi:Rieske Fe-S protein
MALGCGGAPTPPDRRLRVPLASLGPSGRLEVEYAGEPAVLVLTATGVVARSLLCSHFGCRVQWEEARERYRCPCHEGLFDGEGRLLGGAPTRPLRALPVEISGRDILVGER